MYNWGTYHDQRECNLAAAGRLLGSREINGAGKSTTLDAISTLLTPPAKRQYNLSSGFQAERQKRSEKKP